MLVARTRGAKPRPLLTADQEARLLAVLRSAKVYLILNGHPAHRAKRVARWERLRLVFLPPMARG
jgi:hypothetical protein